MVESKTIATVAVAVVLSLLGALLLNGSRGASGPSGHNGQDGKDGSSFGALVSPDIASPFLSFGGVRSWAWSPTLTAASVTVCSVQAPAATSTLIHASLTVNSQPYANTYEIGIATSATATTTRVALRTLNGTVSPDFLNAVASSTVNQQGAVTASGNEAPINKVVGPHQFVNVNVSTSSASATFAPDGHCNVVFREL